MYYIIPADFPCIIPPWLVPAPDGTVVRPHQKSEGRPQSKSGTVPLNGLHDRFMRSRTAHTASQMADEASLAALPVIHYSEQDAQRLEELAFDEVSCPAAFSFSFPDFMKFLSFEGEDDCLCAVELLVSSAHPHQLPAKAHA